jgi:hypothetical protein
MAMRYESTPGRWGLRWPVSRALAATVLAASVAACAAPATKEASAAVTSSLAAAGDASEPAVPPGYKKVERNGQTVYCVQEPETGTRLRSRTICRTRDQLRDQEIANRRTMDEGSSWQRMNPQPLPGEQ